MAQIERKDLIFDIQMALKKATFIPKKWGMEIELKATAEQIADHLKLCGIECHRRERPLEDRDVPY